MDDGIHARPRMNWNSVTDVGGNGVAPPDTPTEKPSFQFDLGGALARLGEHDEHDEPASAEPVPEPELAEPRVDVEPGPPARPAPMPEPGGAEPPAMPAPGPAPADPGTDPPAPPPPVAPPLDQRRPPQREVAPDPADDPLSSVRGLLEPDRPPGRPNTSEHTHRSHTTPPGSVFAEDVPAAPAAAPPPPPAAPPAEPAAPAAPPAPTKPGGFTWVPTGQSAEPAQAAAAPAAPAPTPVAPAPAASAPSAPAPIADPAPAVASASVPTETPIETPTAAPSPSIPADAAGVPVLPAAPAAATPVVTEPIESAPSTPDVIALRSAQLRANKQQHQGKMFGRAVIGVMSIAGLLAGALIFGRAYLFPTEWDASLTPIVDEIQQARGADFDHTVPLVIQPTTEYAATLLTSSIGSGWAEALPQWRAAGLAAGNATVDSITAELAALVPVVYDPGSDTIYQSADADPASITDDLRVVLNQVYAAQFGSASDDRAAAVGFTGVSSPEFLAERAVDAFLVGTTDVEAGDETDEGDEGDEGDDTPPPAGLPLPLAYEIAAIDHLGEAILVGANIDPASMSLGQPYPEAIVRSLDDSPTRTASGLVEPGERSLAEPIALGVDDWSLVWGARLPAPTVDRVVELVTGDSYRPIDRAGTTCFLAVFQAASEPDASELFTSMLLWANNAPAGAQAAATLLGPNRVQIEACDPGESDATPPDSGAVDALITRQIERLAR